jgi:hypothetical protein
MRCLHGLALARLLRPLLALCVLSWAQDAAAGVTYDFAFRSTDKLGDPISGGSVSGGGHSFTFTPAAAQACEPTTKAAPGCAVLDVLLITTTPLVSASVSVAFDDSNGLAAARASRWVGVGIVFGMLPVPVVIFGPAEGPKVDCTATTCGSFDGAIPPPNGPPSLPPGTYDIGTVVWDTTSATGASALMTAILAGDGTFGVVNGNVVDLTGSEVLKQGLILVPEPGAAGLMGLGLVALVRLNGRRRGRRPHRAAP